jgi:1-acyl-sn-glycerol-3-phosphate acyltransferase
MIHESYFRLLKLYSDIWARRHCRVVLGGEDQLCSVTESNRVYIVSHPTTWDLPLLAHISKDHFYIVVAEGPFAHPLVKWLFRNSGFLKLDADSSESVVDEAAGLVMAKHPLIMSLKGYGVDFGEKVRPRTGGIRMADTARADIYPVHLMIEEGKMIFKAFKKGGAEYPFTVFHDTLYFATFCKPLLYRDYHRDGMSYENYKEIAYSIEKTFDDAQARLEGELKDGRYAALPRRGGSPKQLVL